MLKAPVSSLYSAHRASIQERRELYFAKQQAQKEAEKAGTAEKAEEAEENTKPKKPPADPKNFIDYLNERDGIGPECDRKTFAEKRREQLDERA